MSAAYEAAHGSKAFVVRSDRVRIEFTGPKAAEALNGLLTNDIAKLAPGMGCYAAALTPKGKVIADVRVFARDDGRFVLDTSAAAGPGLLAMLRKYVNPRLATWRDITAEFGDVTVLGPFAASDFASLAAYGSVAANDGGFIARVPDFGLPATAMIVRPEFLEGTIRSLRAEMPELDSATAEVLRVEAGRPLWGADMDENTLAQEAALDRADLGAISFDKGCYTGQETVARVHFRGHVNRTLRGLRFHAPPTPAGDTAGANTPVPRSALRHPSQNPAGELRSIAHSPRLGLIALAYVRKEVADGEVVEVDDGHGGALGATVTALPFSTTAT
ncbi:MAG: folate-binding protein YgfZ [Gemmatimonadetes bacterium]|nr:folate-binding protein YgfZ [Gemmatimonadota bacterium]